MIDVFTQIDRRHRRRGLSMVELLVVIGIVGLLAGLMLPAVQAAREAARRSQCAANMKQYMIGVHSFEARRGAFPTGVVGSPLSGPFAGRLNYSAAHAALLADLGHPALFNAINFDLPCLTPADFAFGNATAAATRVGLFLCPSDRASPAAFATNNVRLNLGMADYERSADGVYHFVDNGAFTVTRHVTAADFRDGLSNTLAVSEKPAGSSAQYDPFRDWVHHAEMPPPGSDAWARICAGPLDPREGRLDAGGTWLIAGVGFTFFHASEPPNSPIPDCGFNTGEGVFAARSYHPGGVNAAMSDGSVRWFRASMQRQMWRSLGTRNRGD